MIEDFEQLTDEQKEQIKTEFHQAISNNESWPVIFVILFLLLSDWNIPEIDEKSE